MRSLGVTLLLLTAYFITWLPYNIYVIFHVFDEVKGFEVSLQLQLNSCCNNDDNNNKPVILQDYAYALHGIVAINSLINPFLYGRISVVKKKSNFNRKGYEQYSSSSEGFWKAFTSYKVQVLDERV